MLPCDLPGKRIDCRWIGKIAEDWKQAWVDIGKGTKPLAVPADKDDSSRRKGKQSLGDRPADSPACRR